jgi:hypothetical protein
VQTCAVMIQRAHVESSWAERYKQIWHLGVWTLLVLRQVALLYQMYT